MIMLAPNVIALALSLLPLSAKALPFLGLGSSSGTSSQATSPVSDATIDSTLVQPAQFSRIAYCTPPAVMSWQCGPPCQATPGVKVLSTGGGMFFDQNLKAFLTSIHNCDRWWRNTFLCGFFYFDFFCYN